MAYNPQLYFPQNYQPMYQPQIPQMPQITQPQQAQQTKYVEVVPVDNIAEAETCPMAAGSSFLFFARDDSFIAVKSVGVNGQQSFSVFDKRPPAPAAPPFDPSAYVTMEELETRLASIIAPKRVKKEDVE